MKKIFLLALLLPLIFACKSTTPVAETNLDKSAQVAVKGNWKITNISYPGSDYIKVNSFDIADSKCFVGSTWNFISNNNKGSLTLNAAGCAPFTSPIVWSINKDGVFVLKIVEPGTKSKTVTQGYLLKVANQTENGFQLIDVINVGSQTKEVVYQFQRIN
jgi:hypothetical protein